MKAIPFTQSLLLVLFSFCFTQNISAQPTFSKVFSPDVIGPGSTTTLTFNITNSSGAPVSSMAFTDVLPAGVTISNPVNLTDNCMGGTLSAPAGGTTISYSGGSLAASSSCAITVSVTSSTPGVHINVSGDLTSDAGNSGTASDNLTIDTSLPGFSKSFSPASVNLGEKSTLTFLIDNTSNVSNVNNLDFTDVLPAGLEIASPTNLTTDCGTATIPPTVTAVAGGNSVTLDANGTFGFPSVAAGASCIVSVDVKSTGVGTLQNFSDDLLAEFVIAGKAIDEIVVTRSDLHIQKEFIDDPVAAGTNIELEFIITNFNRDDAATALGFSDDLDATLSGMTFDSAIENTCGGMTTSMSGDGTFNYVGGSLAAQGSCTIRINCIIPSGAASGSYPNTTSAVTADVGGSTVVGNMASDNLHVQAVPVFTKEFLDAATLMPDPVVGAGDDVVLRFNIQNQSSSFPALDISFLDELTNFLPSPLVVSLPATPCGAGSSVSLVSTSFGEGIELEDGNLSAAGMPGDNCSFDITITLPTDLPQGTYTNVTEQITLTVDGAMITGGTATDDFVVVEAPTLMKEFLADPVDPGTTVDLEFTLTHDALAPTDASNISFTDDLDATLTGLVATAGELPLSACGGTLTGSAGDSFLTFSGGSLMPGETCSITVTLDVPMSATPGTHSNTTSNVTAMVSGTTATGNPASDGLEITSLVLTKEFIDDPVIPGEIATLRFTIDNPTAEDITGISFSDNVNDMLSGATLTGMPPSNPCGMGSTLSYVSANRQLSFSGGNLTSLSNCSFDVQVQTPLAAADGSYNNVTTSPSFILGGSNLSSDPATDILEVNASLIQLEKEFTDDPVLPGNTVNVEFTITNLDPVNALSAIAFQNDFAASIAGATISTVPMAACGGTAANLGSGIFDFSGGSLAGGASCSFSVEVQIPSSTAYGATIPCTTNAPSGTISGLPVTGAPASDDLTTSQIVFTKTITDANGMPGPIVAGENARIEFSISNFDPSLDATDIIFTDDLNAFITGTTSNFDVPDACGLGSSLSGVGTSTLTFSGGSVSANTGCSFQVLVAVPCGTTTGRYTNTTSDITYRIGGSADTSEAAIDSLDITAASAASFTVPSDITIECDESTNPSNTGSPSNIMHSCCTMGFTSNFTDTNNVTTCSNTTGSITRTWTVTDCNGIVSGTQEQTITIVDTTNPTVSNPADINVQCFSDIPAADITVVTDEADNCDGSPTVAFVSDDINSATCDGDMITVTRTYSVTDCSGNSITVTQNINVDDTTNPTASNPADISVQCFSDIPAADITVVTDEADNCDGSPAVAFVSDDINSATCDGDMVTVTRTYSVTDCSGNSITVTQDIIVDDTMVPTASNPADISVQCFSDIPAADITVVTDEADNCDGTPTVAFVSDDITTATCDGDMVTVTRTYSVTDCSGNSITVTQDIIVDDTMVPTASNPADISVQCFSDIPAADITVVTDEVDNCDGSPTVAFVSDDINSATCDGDVVTVTRTYSVTDCSGNSITVTQDINVDDTTDPTASNPTDIAVQCFSDIPAADITVVTDEDDNCDGSPTVAFVSDDINSATCDGDMVTVTRTYSVTDCSGNSITVTQDIIVDDTMDPTASNPADISVQCFSDIPAADITVVTDEADNCDGSPTVAFVNDDINSATCDGDMVTVTRTYSVTDCSGNSITVTQDIIVDDTTNPTASNPADISVQCFSDLPTADITVVTDEDDNCDGSPTVAFVSDDINSATCDGDVVTVTRTYSVTDCSGNSITITQNINVDDTTDPTASNPADIDVQCFSDIPAADITVVTDEADNCDGTPTVAFVSDDITTATCDGDIVTVTRTYSVTDCSGNSITITQNINVDDTTDPTASNPADIDVQCFSDIPAADITVVTDEADNCDGTPTVAFVSDDITTATCDGDIVTVTRTYSVTDCSGNSITITQNINVDDTTDPTASNPSDINVQCLSDVPPPDVTVVIDEDDNCEGDPTVAFVSDNISLNDCSTGVVVITRSYSVTDCSGNSILVVQSINVDDDTVPDISCPANTTVECDESSLSSDTGIATATDNCDADPDIAESDNSSQTSDGSCSDFAYTITRTFTATDVCGNTNTCQQIISVEDTTDPSASCNELTITLEMSTSSYTLTQTDINNIALGSNDNCDTNLDYNTSKTFFECADAPATQLVLTVTDACGNTDTCVSDINVLGGVPPITSGTYGPVCENGETIILSGSPVPPNGDTGEWSGAGVTDSDNTDGEAIFNPSGLSGLTSVTFTYTTFSGCMDMVSTEILVNDVPNCSAGNNGPICAGFNLNLSESGGDAVGWEWEGPNGFSSSAQNPVIMSAIPSATGTYTVTVTDVNGCTSVCSTDATVWSLPVITSSECFCAYDPNIDNYGSQVELSVNNGAAPYTITTSFGILEKTVVDDNETFILYTSRDGGAYTITVTDANGCEKVISGACSPCYFESETEINDPCSCNNDQSYNGSGDGTFGEIVNISGPSGLSLIIGAGSTGLISYNLGDAIPENIPGMYSLNFDHIDRVGYELFLEGRSGNNTFPILDSNGNQVSIGNVCQYPIITEPELDITAFCNNGTPLIFTGNEVEEINGFNGSVQVYVGSATAGILISEFDPTEYSNGYYTLTFLFTGDFIDNVSNGIDPAFPGCQTQTSILVGVGGGGSLTCNDNVNMTVNAQCELDFSWYTLLESDAIPDIFEPQFFSPSGTPVLESELGNFIGSYVQYSIVDECNGNSCWGTIHIDDKTDPVIDCEICPPVNGTSVNDYNPDCVLNCYEQPVLQLRYDDGLRDDLIQEDYEDFVEDAMTDNCNNYDEEDVSFYDQYTSLGACTGTRLTRTWTVGFQKADGSRGTVSCTREYFFRPLDLTTIAVYPNDANGNPIIAPVEDALVLPPDRINLPCGVDVSPEGIAAFFDDPLTVDRDTDDNNIDPDELDVDLVVENNEGNAWAYPHFYQDGVGSGGPHPQAINNEICNLIAGYTDSEIDACAPGCGGNRKVLRNWTVLDWCTAQFVTYGQIIKSIDQNPPSLTVPDVVVSVDPWNCEAAVNLPAPEHMSDDCDANISYSIGNRNGFDLSGDATEGFVLHGVPLGTHTIEYKSEDCCGNIGRTTMTVTVVDNTPPVAVSKEFIVISLTNVGNPVDQFQGAAKLHAEDVDNGSYDGCSGVSLSVRRSPVCDADDAEWGAFVSFCCEDLNGGTQANIDVELRILDENGNENIVWATVLLEDKSATIPQIPPHMFLTCDMDYNNLEMTGGVPRFFGACGEAQIECDTAEVYENTEPDELRLSDGVVINGIPQEAPAYDPSCGYGAIKREFRDCGGGVQWFVILPVDPFDPSTITWPEDVVVDCDDYGTGEPSWEEATCKLVGVSMQADTFLFEDGACFKILNHWSVINWCIYDPSNPSAGGKYEYTQTIKIIDTVDPVLTVEDSLCFAVTVDCVSSDVNLSGSATDEGDCGSEWISWDVSIDAYADWTEDFHYATTNPRLLANGEPNPFHIAKTGNGEAATITLPDGIPSSKIWHRAVWRAFDGCGNTSSVTRYFQIVDKKAPTPYCLNLSTAVMSNGQVELWAIDFNVGSFDNCTDSDNLLFTFTDVAPPPRDDTEYDSNSDLMWYSGTFWYYDSTNGDYESQDDYGGDVHRWEPGLQSAGKVFTASDADATGFAQVPIYVWDECGNRDFCLVNLRLVDNGGGGMAMVSGQVKTEFGQEVEQVLTELDGPLNFRETDVTDAQGEYAFTNTPFYADYQVRGEKSDDYLNGVSTLDLIIIQRHILSIESLDSPYKMIAADANSDNEVSALDLIELRKLILGIYDELPDNGSWKFINADNTLSIDSPWNYSETRSIEDLAADMMAEDFVGVKIGDLNGTAQANATMSGDEVSTTQKAVELSYEDKIVREGELVEVSFTTERNDIYGYQFTLNTPGLELVEVQGVKAENIAVFEDKLTMSYNKTQAIEAGTLVTLVMKATTSARVSDLLDMGSELTRAEAYVGDGLDVVNISLDNSEKAEGEFAMYQNEPNPFSDNTTIGFKLPEAGQAKITLYDVTGKVLKVIQGQYGRGYNTVNVTKEDLGVALMVIYKLEYQDQLDVRHMIIMD